MNKIFLFLFFLISLSLTFAAPDVNVLSLSFDKDLNSIQGIDTNVLISLDVNNVGDENLLDYNFVVYLNDDLLHSEVIDYNLNVGDSNTFSYTWVFDENIGSFDINACIFYGSDMNCMNSDYNIFFYDLNINSFENLTLDANVLDPIDFTCQVGSLGLDVSSDFNVNFLVNGSLYDYNTIEGLDSSFLDVNFTYIPHSVGDYNFGCELSYEYDFNSSNNSLELEPFSVSNDTLVDLTISNITINSTVRGTTSQATCIVKNLASSDTATQDYNVLFYVDSSLQSTKTESENIDAQSTRNVNFSWSPSTAKSYSLKCEVEYNITDANIDNNSYTKSFTITNPTSTTTSSSSNSSSSSSSSTGYITPTLSSTLNAKLMKAQKYQFFVDKVLHSLEVSVVKKNSVEFYLNSEKTFHKLAVGESAFKDYNNDGFYDIKVTVQSLENERFATFKFEKVNIKVEDPEPQTAILSETITSDVNELDFDVNEDLLTMQNSEAEPKSSKTLIYSLISIFFILILAFLVYYFRDDCKRVFASSDKKKNKHNPFHYKGK